MTPYTNQRKKDEPVSTQYWEKYFLKFKLNSCITPYKSLTLRINNLNLKGKLLSNK